MYAVTTTQIARLLPGIILISLPHAWADTLQPVPDVFTSFYNWLSEHPSAKNSTDLRPTTFFGKRLFNTLIKAERERLRKHYLLAGDSLDERVAWTLLDNTAATTIGNCHITDAGIMIVPDADLASLNKIADTIYQEKLQHHIHHIKRAAQGHTFYDWMTAQIERPDAIGDLARYMDLDELWPCALSTLEEIRSYLESQAPSGLFRQELAAAWTEYQERYPHRTIAGRCHHAGSPRITI